MKLPANIRRKANAITAKYNRWMLPQEVRPMYAELEAIGVSVGMVVHGRNRAEVYYNGEETDNSSFVYNVYEGNGESLENEYNIYIS